MGNQLANRKRRSRGRAIRLGYVPLLDCAPLIMARELGLFAARGLDVNLTREIGWATVRDKVVFGELDAAHAPAGMVFATTLGLRTPPTACMTGLVLNAHGNGIVLSRKLWKAGIRDGHALRNHIRETHGLMTFGVVHQWSSHNVLLRQWLRSYGIRPDEDVHIVVIPPSQLVDNLRAGHIEGFCVGEPWNTLTEARGVGNIVAYSADFAPEHPEKVLMVRADFDERSHDEHRAMISALREACKFCEAPANREALVSALSEFDGAAFSEDVVRAALGGATGSAPSLIRFSGDDVNCPTSGKATWVLDGLRREGLIPHAGPESVDLTSRCFRPDLYESEFPAGVSSQSEATKTI